MKKHISLLTAITLALCLTVSSGATALEQVETTAQGTEVQAVLAAETVTPGINVLTGTADAETFETWDVFTANKDTQTDNAAQINSLSNGKFSANGGWSSKPGEGIQGANLELQDSTGTYWGTKLSSVTGYDPGKMLAIAVWGDGSAHTLHLWFAGKDVLEAGRKYSVSFDAYSDAAGGLGTTQFFIEDEWGSEAHGVHGAIGGLNSAGTEWSKNLNATVTASAASKGIGFQWAISAYTANNATKRLWIDNLVCMPYYKITYKGETDTTEQYLFDESGNVATEYSVKSDNYPSADGKTCIGWSTEENATEAITTIALANQDIVLYPVWQEAAEEETAPTTLAFNQIRKDDTVSGIRFASHVGDAVKTKATQAGFVVALTEALGENALAFDTANAPVITEAGKTVGGKTAEDVSYLAAANFVKDGADIYYADTATGNELFGLNNADGTYYTVVLNGFDREYTKGEVTYANRYAVDFTVRAFVLIDGAYYYGDAYTTNMAAVAATYLESDDAELKAFAQVVVDTANDIVTPEVPENETFIDTSKLFQ